MPTEKSAGAVVFRKEKGIIYYLLLQEVNYWGFSKGIIEKGEELKETVKREVEEETGIRDIDLVPGFKESIKYFYRRGGKTIFKTVIFYLAETKTKEIKLSFEHIGFDWLLYEEALDRLTYKNAKDILKKANNFILKLET